MKYFLLSLIFLTSAFNCVSQEETTAFEQKKWTIKSILMSQPYTFKKENPLPFFFTGIGLKRNFGAISARASFERLVNAEEEDALGKDGFFKENIVRLGSEYNKSYYDVLQLGFYIDFTLNKFESVKSTDSINQFLMKHESLTGYSVGSSFGIGIEYFISETFSLAMETRMDLLRTTGDYILNNYIKNYKVQFTESYTDFQLKILGNVSINYHF